ncbi:MAG: type II toxin-antitoxin system PemK/MazF family toxin [Candidatus Omnitrophota bacterium]
MTKYKCKDVVLVDVVFSDGSGIKKRPALVLSSNEYHKSRREVIIAAVTSNVHRVLCGDTKIKKWKEAGLLVPSLVTGIIQTITGKLINRKLGILEEEDFQKVQKSLKRAVEL